MPRVIPSQVVALIEAAFPQATHDLKVYSSSAPTLSAIVQLVAQIPEELLAFSGDDHNDFLCSLEGLKYAVNHWLEHGGNDPPAKIRRKSPIIIIRDVLTKCPDQQPSPTTAVLGFISDVDYRNSVRNDISTAYSSLHNSEWKPATVLAGAAVEALLLWAIDTSGKSASIAKPKKPLDQWNLSEYIAGAEQLALVKRDTASLARQAQNFRNLIHPGRAVRLGTRCDKGSSLAALAAVELVIRDLTS